ncbi:hypothetical protein [Flavivirga algicola]|uniref:Uncharacterized protein n=1 Tax=Flavivirga algicola TaxID=2729136 RepID=A0ABX1RUM3_9FLAO|nr:hypothetical protein [Flavivirga algicola]NMH87242.1 hypothetical protein [Flavivirga algicola]
MKKIKKYIILITAFVCWSKLMAQQPPLPVEIFGGHRALSYQHVINKKIFEKRFGFFNITTFDAEYKEDPRNVYLISSMFSYNIGKGFSAGLGGEIQRPGAFVYVGAQYAYTTQQLLFVLFPSMNLNGYKQYSQFALLEYRPKLNENYRGYFKMQFLVTTDFHNYDRGYQQFRLGLQRENIQFGLATNFDQFNSNAITTNNFGFFVRTLFF